MRSARTQSIHRCVGERTTRLCPLRSWLGVAAADWVAIGKRLPSMKHQEMNPLAIPLENRWRFWGALSMPAATSSGRPLACVILLQVSAVDAAKTESGAPESPSIALDKLRSSEPQLVAPTGMHGLRQCALVCRSAAAAVGCRQPI